MLQRQQRFGMYEPFAANAPLPNTDVLHYTPTGNSFKLGIFPRLGSIFPDLEEITVPCRAGVKSPASLPFTRGGTVAKEVNNRVYLVYVVGFYGGILEVKHPMPESEYQFIAIICDRSGKVVKTVTGPGEAVLDNLAEAANFALYFMAFEAGAKPMPPREMPTNVEPIDPVSLTQSFSTTVKIEGGGVYSLRRSMADVRAAKKDPTSFQFWQEGWTWKAGNRIAFIGKDWTGAYHIATFERGQMIDNGHTLSFQSAITETFRQLNA